MADADRPDPLAKPPTGLPEADAAHLARRWSTMDQSERGGVYSLRDEAAHAQHRLRVAIYADVIREEMQRREREGR